MRLRAAAAALALAAGPLAVAVLAAAPARAATPSVTISGPGDGAVVSDGNAVHIQGSASAGGTGGTITGELSVTITSAAGHPGWSTSVPHWCGQASCAFTLTSGALPYNGRYTLTVSATESDPPVGSTTTQSASSSFSLAVAPAAPSGVTAVPSGDGSEVDLSWNPNPEPDLVGYQVDRSPQGAGFPTTVTSPSFVDTGVSPGGTYAYSITAVRAGATSGSTVASAPTGASASVPVPATDATPGSGGSGSGASGSGAGGSGAAAGSGSGGSGSSASGGSATGGRGSLGTYGKAGTAPPAGAQLPGFPVISAQGAGVSGPAALPAPAVPAVPGAALEADGVAPGSDNPAVAPFSSGTGGVSPAASGRMTVTYASGGLDHRVVVRDFAAVALAGLLLAVVAHLLWLRRQVLPAGAGEGGDPSAA